MATLVPTQPGISVSASNLGGANHTENCPSHGTYKCAIGFTTGPASGGYTLNSATLQFADTQNVGGGLGDIVVTVHADSSGLPGTVLATLSGVNPSTAGEYTFTCTTGCNLAANTTYFIQVSALAGSRALLENYHLRTTLSDAEVLVPTGNDWSLAGEMGFYRGTAWQTPTDVPKLKIDAVTR